MRHAAAAGVIFSLLFFPGLLLAPRLAAGRNRTIDADRIVPLSLALSLAYFLPFFAVSYLFTLPFRAMASAWAAGLAVLLFFARRLRGDVRIAYENPGATFWFLACAVLLPLSVWGPEMHVDAFASIALLRKLAAAPVVRFADAFFPDVAPDPLYGLDAWHGLLAAVVRLAPLDPEATWRGITFALSATMLASVRVLTRAVFPERDVAAGALGIFLAVYVLLDGAWIFSSAGFPMEASAFVFLPLFAACLLSSGEDPAVRRVVLLLGVVLPFVHPMGLALAVALALGLAALEGILRLDSARATARLGLGVLALAAPIVLLKRSLGTVVSCNGIYPHSFRFLGEGGWGFFEPRALLAPDYVARAVSGNEWIYLLAYLAAPACLFFLRARRSARLLFVSAALPPLLLLNPVTTRFLAPWMSYLLVRRFSMLPLVWLLLAAPLLLLPPPRRRLAAAAAPLLLLAAAAAIPGARLYLRDFPSEDRIRHVGVWTERYRDHRVPFGALARLDATALPGATIVADHRTSLYLAARTDRYILYSFPDYAGPSYPPERLAERAREHDAFFRGAMSETDLADLVRRRDVGGFLVDDSAAAARATLDRSGLVERAWEEDGAILYRTRVSAAGR